MAMTRRTLIGQAGLALLTGNMGLVATGCSRGPELGPGRAVSLNQIARQVRDRPASSDAETLGGITRLLGFAEDTASGDLVLFGDADPAWPRLELEDLVVALRNAYHYYAARRDNTVYYEYPGCSIDPDSATLARLGALGKLLGEAQTSEIEARAKTAWMQVCRSPQRVRTFGIPASRFANICIDADYRMKALCDGTLEFDVANFESLTRHRITNARAALRDGTLRDRTGSSNRFWFTPGRQRYAVDEGIAVVKAFTVALQTEHNIVTAQGERVNGSHDALAHEWATDFTRLYREIAIREGSGIYLKLQQLFEHVAIAKLLAARTTRGASPGLQSLLDDYELPAASVPDRLPGRGNLVSIDDRTGVAGQSVHRSVTLQVCGGVGIDIDPVGDDLVDNDRRLAAVRGEVLAARPGVSALSWDVATVNA